MSDTPNRPDHEPTSAGSWAQAEPPERKRRAAPVVAIAVAAVLVLGGIAAAVGFFLLRGSPDVLSKMAPADADVYVTVYLDPSAGQKLALRSLASRFPAVGKNGVQDHVDSLLEPAFRQSGLSFERDVKPWLGSQIAIVGKVTGERSLAVLIASKDDGAAQTAMRKALASTGGTLHGEQHGDTTITVSMQPGSSTPDVVTAYANHTAIIGSDVPFVGEIIDTAEGGASSLDSSSAYQHAVDGVPKSRLVLAYVDFGSILQQIQSGLPGQGAASPFLPGGLVNPNAYGAMVATLRAESNGVALDASVTIDRSKLTAEQQQLLDTTGDISKEISLTPADAYGVMAQTGLRQAIQGIIDVLQRQDPSVADQAQQLGLTGPGGVVDQLTGDYGITAGPWGADGGPGGAFMVGTTNEGKLRSLLDRLAEMAIGEAADQGQGPAQRTQERYLGSTIVSLAAPELQDAGFLPSYTVTHGQAIVGTTANAVKSVLRAQAGQDDTIDTSERYRAVIHQTGSPTQGILYVDVGSVLDAVRKAIPPAVRSGFEQTARNIEPVRALAFTSDTQGDRQRVHLFVLIE
ncbi:MAG: DUF3352 domain-containing protein [Actinomycetota bacterium]